MFALGGDKLTQFKMTFIARKLTNTIEFFIADSRSTGEMWKHNSAGEKDHYFLHIYLPKIIKDICYEQKTTLFLHEQK